MGTAPGGNTPMGTAPGGNTAMGMGAVERICGYVVGMCLVVDG